MERNELYSFVNWIKESTEEGVFTYNKLSLDINDDVEFNEVLRLWERHKLLFKVIKRIKDEDDINIGESKGKLLIYLPSGRNLELSEAEIQHHIQCIQEESMNL